MGHQTTLQHVLVLQKWDDAKFEVKYGEIINFDLKPNTYFEKINMIRSRLNMNEQDEVAFF